MLILPECLPCARCHCGAGKCPETHCSSWGFTVVEVVVEGLHQAMLGGRMKQVTGGQGDEFQDTAALLQGLREGGGGARRGVSGCGRGWGRGLWEGLSRRVTWSGLCLERTPLAAWRNEELLARSWAGSWQGNAVALLDPQRPQHGLDNTTPVWSPLLHESPTGQ